MTKLCTPIACLWPDRLLLAREPEDDGVEVKVGEEFLGAVRRVGEECGGQAAHQHRDHRDQHAEVPLALRPATSGFGL